MKLKQIMWKRIIWWWKVWKQYLANCSIHGVRYLVDDHFSWPERLFWLFFCILSWYGCAIMVTDVIRNYIKYHVAVTTETMYVDWNTPFPAIVFCITSTKAIKAKYIKRNAHMFTNFTNPNGIKATAEELLSAYDELKAPCTEFLADCSWNNVKFNCCTEFQELRKTGVGYCVAMNSIHVSNNGKPSVKLFVNRTVNYGDLVIDIFLNPARKQYSSTDFTVHVLNNLELPMIANFEKDVIPMRAGKTTNVGFTIEDTFNEDGIRDVEIAHRSCRFPQETLPNNIFNIYSSASCTLEVIIERMIKYCGCVHFYYAVPRGARVCNGREMLCLIANKSNIIAQDAEDEQCLPDCEGTLLTINRLEPYESESPDEPFSRLHFTLFSHPTIRYRRYIVTDLLDVIVAVGSAAGLFMGASILSIFEIPYWLFIRRDKIT